MQLPRRGTLHCELALIGLGSTIITIVLLSATLLIVDASVEHLRLHHHIAWFSLGVVVLTSLLTTMAGALLKKRIYSPIERLVRVMSAVSEGQNYQTRVSLDGSQELQVLANGFNRMLAEIQRRDQELLQQNGVLESELAARAQMNVDLQRARDDAEAANRAKSEFLANMSHEIRTPMNGVIGMTELALETELNAEQREYMAMVKTSAESLLTIINDVLDFSKIEAGRIELEEAEFNLYDLVSETLRTLAPSAHRKDLELAYDIRPEVPEAVIGDPLRVRQALLNVVANAIKFTERGEVVLVVERDVERGADTLRFTVRDTGIGIPTEKQQTIFDPFSQADSSQTRKYGGTGLGLAITSRLVNLMSGAIWLNSHVGQGSEFHLAIPLPAGSPVKRDIPLFLHGIAALVVDDNLTNRKVVAGMLNSFGMKADNVESALRARSALEAAAASGDAYKLVVIDGEMPEMDGFQLAEVIHKNPALAGATIVMLTCGFRQPQQIARCRELGVQAYLLKPIRRTELLKAVVRVMAPVAAAPARQVSKAAATQNQRALRILAAEDNRVNQRLLVRLLEKAGHEVTVVEDGDEAVALSGKFTFDAILMDVQMPKMDGLEAARQIRAREKRTGERIPIIALTAHALKGDRERCLDAGMDMYIAKPLDKQELFRALDSCRRGGDPAPSPVKQATMDLSQALERTGGDRMLLNEMCEVFLQESASLMEQISRSLKEGEPGEVCRLAHRLKTSAGTIGGVRASDAAASVENALHDKSHSSLTVPAGLLLQEVTVLRSAVSDYLSTV
jgi:signal transduction histidine kinase/CheY-like chemotaxis protein